MADEKTTGGYGKGYGKRPLWQWILIYLVVGGALYYGIYYFFMGGKDGGYNSGSGIYQNQ
jgi:hypothetical protein